jgi:transposase
VPTSADTLLRFQRAAAPADAPTPRVLGVDDLSLRRGYTYATLLVDLETHRPVDLLGGREAGVLGAWLRRHPGVEVVARDRSGAYAEGARAGAPGATQVADRFHLLQNASAALDEVLRGRCQRLDAELAGTGATDADRRDRAMPARPVGPSERATAEQRAARVARWEQARALRAAGQTVRAIAAALAVDPKTARRLVASPEPPRNRSFRADPLASAALRPFVPYLEERWRTGCTDACRLFREIAGRGYCGSRRSLSRALEPWRGAGPPVPGARRRRSARWLLLRPPAALSPAEREALGRLLAAHPDLAAAHGLVQRFRALVADRAADRLDAWLDEAGVSGLAPFEALAVGLATDRLAVDAALHLRWSTGPVEGHVHRVKLLKRRGYGRAKLDLLRARVLAA